MTRWESGSPVSKEEEQWRTCSPRSQKTSPSGGEVRPPEPKQAPREHDKGTMHQSIFIEAVCRRQDWESHMDQQYTVPHPPPSDEDAEAQRGSVSLPQAGPSPRHMARFLDLSLASAFSFLFNTTNPTFFFYLFQINHFSKTTFRISLELQWSRSTRRPHRATTTCQTFPPPLCHCMNPSLTGLSTEMPNSSTPHPKTFILHSLPI